MGKSGVRSAYYSTREKDHAVDFAQEKVNKFHKELRRGRTNYRNTYSNQLIKEIPGIRLEFASTEAANCVRVRSSGRTAARKFMSQSTNVAERII